MHLNIKSEGSHDRFKEMERLEREHETSMASRAERLLAIGRVCAALPVLDRWSPEAVLHVRHGITK